MYPSPSLGARLLTSELQLQCALKRYSIYAYKCSFSYYGRGIQPIPSLFEVSSLLNYWAFLLLWACFQNRYYLVFKYMDSLYWATVLAVSEFCWLRHHYHLFNHYHKNHKLSEKNKLFLDFIPISLMITLPHLLYVFFFFSTPQPGEPGKPHISVCIF